LDDELAGLLDPDSSDDDATTTARHRRLLLTLGAGMDDDPFAMLSSMLS